MTQAHLLQRLREVIREDLPLPGDGSTSLRHQRLTALGCEDLSLARLAEAHFDATAILAEAGRKPADGALYGVWASEIPGQSVRLDQHPDRLIMNGTKRFCTGANIIDHALVTVSSPDVLLLDIDLRGQADLLAVDVSSWKSNAFCETNTATVTFCDVPVSRYEIVGEEDWYLSRAGFWHGACGPAACWAGGAIALIDWAMQQKRCDAHTLAHLGAMHADRWSLLATLDAAGNQIDASPNDSAFAHQLALTTRHLVEQACSDVLHRLTRAFGPHPLAMDADISRRYQELDLYLRQSHAERDLEQLGKSVRNAALTSVPQPKS